MRSAWFRVLAVMAGLCVAASLGTASAAEPPGSVALAIDGAFPDPSFITDGTTYYAYATGGGGNGAFPYATAPTTDGPWTRRGPSMDRVPAWAGPTPEGDYNFWAPSVFRNATASYVMYFTANNRTTNDRCVGAAESAGPAGGFVPRPAPLLCVRGAQVIDAAPYVGAGPQRFVVYKVKRPVAGGIRFEIRANRTDPGGSVLTSPARTLVAISGANIEAPDVIASGGKVFLFVARGSFTNCTYRTDVWRADSLWDGTWRPTGTLMDTVSTGLCGPGGAEVRRVDGKTWMVFHAWKCADSVPDCRPGDEHENRRYRALYTGLVGWGPDGRTPHVLDHR